jgi:hypothetical protein
LCASCCTLTHAHNLSFLCSLSKPYCAKPMEPTLPEQFRTWNMGNPSVYGDWTKYHPWRAPGYAPVADSCGRAGATKLCVLHGPSLSHCFLLLSVRVAPCLSVTDFHSSSLFFADGRFSSLFFTDDRCSSLFFTDVRCSSLFFTDGRSPHCSSLMSAAPHCSSLMAALLTVLH